MNEIKYNGEKIPYTIKKSNKVKRRIYTRIYKQKIKMDL